MGFLSRLSDLEKQYAALARRHIFLVGEGFIHRFAVIFLILCKFTLISVWASGDEAPPGFATTSQPTPCPNSEKMLFLSDAAGSPDLWMMDRSTGKGVLFLDWPESVERFPEWSPTCDRIYFKSTRGGTEEEWSFWVVDSDGKNPRNEGKVNKRSLLTPGPSFRDSDLDQGIPGPKGILFTYSVDGTIAIFISDSKSNNKQQLTFPEGTADFDPQWDPVHDGIVFVRDEGIWSQSFSGKLKRLTRLSALSSPKGDLNYDGCVDQEDSGVAFSDIKGESPHDWAHDVNGDGFVNSSDLDALVRLYSHPGGKPCR